MFPLKHHPSTSREELIALKEQLGTWRAVAKHLGLSVNQLQTLRRDLDVPFEPSHARPSQLIPYHDRIAALAAEGCTTPEIVHKLGLNVQPERVRRFIHQHNIPLLTKAGAQHGERNLGWKGGRRVDKAGYVLIRRPDHPLATRRGYVLEHRLVMEQMLGRYLEPEEVVHRLNGDRADNRPENLMLFASNREHLKATKLGQRPNWTEAGKARMIEALSGVWERRRAGRTS